MPVADADCILPFVWVASRNTVDNQWDIFTIHNVTAILSPRCRSAAVRVSLALDVYIVQFEQKNYSFKKKDSSLTGFKINPILLEN